MTSPRSLLTLALLASLSLPACAATPKERIVPIGDVQGEGARSPLDGQTVTVEGVVTTAFANLGGVFVQDAGDGKATTSDALFVAFEDGTPAPLLTAGDRIRVRGIVGERKAGGDDTLTALHAPVIQSRGTGRIAPTVLTAQPADWERYEGMLVRIDAPLTLSGTDALGRFGELTTSFGGRLWQPSEVAVPGSADAKRLAADNARRTLVLDDGSTQRDPATVWYVKKNQPLRTGTVLTGAQGIVDARHGGWRLQLTVAPTIAAPERPAAPQIAGTVRIAAFNLENLFNGDGKGGGFPTERGAKTAAQYQAQVQKLVGTIRGLDPDIAALMELENDGYGADSSLAQLVAALNADGGTWRFIDAKQGPGPDTIRVGIIYRSDKVTPTGKPATLQAGPFGERSRSPLAQAFVRGTGKPFVVVANHLKSKGCSEATGLDADQKDGAGCWNALRLDSAQRLDAWLKTDPTRTRSDRVVMLGDFNAYAMEAPVRWLRDDAGWVDAFKQAGIEQPYSYVYNDLSGRLDHALLSPSLAKQLRGAAEWHINADEQDAQGYADGDPTVPFRSSDHDPLLLGFDL
ncbi:ExeM/NucH family extracellular endonuclease [uncultured Pseudoxanthomonas sp.]|uniref:ExeM/NucH family extracellular endonuclease n=1 Tax=uncultured Pseudoxanthomonas sp. TaxID=281701 RepID=UPI00260397F2|nr:ExeM/NucH family extracellular endonuclease [uncultured Pseudoxanthomonas sp.]